MADDTTKKRGTESDRESTWGRAKDHAKGALDWSRKISKVGKLKLDSTRLQRARGQAYVELGERTYGLLKEGRFDPTELDKLVTQIDELTQKIDEYKQAIDEAARGLHGTSRR